MFYVTEAGTVFSAHHKLSRAKKALKRWEKKTGRTKSLSIWKIRSPGGWRGPDGNSRQWQIGDTPSAEYWMENVSGTPETVGRADTADTVDNSKGGE